MRRGVCHWIQRYGPPSGSAVHQEDLQSRSHERNSVGPCCSQNLLSPATFSSYPGLVQIFFLPNMSASMHILTRDDDDALNCGSGGGADTFFGLRVASIFIISACSTFGALFPVLVKSSSWLHVPKSVFESVFLVKKIKRSLINRLCSFAKYFGSGVIVHSIMVASKRTKRTDSFVFLDRNRFYPSLITRS